MTQNLSQNPDMITCLWCQLCLFELFENFEFCPTWPSKRIWTVWKWKPLTLLAWLYLHFTTHIEGYLDISGYHKAIKQFICIGLWMLVVWLVSFNIFRCHMVSQHLHSFSTEAKVPLVPTSSASASGQEDATIFQQCSGFRFGLFHSHPKASTAKRSAKSGNIFGTTCQALRIS